MLDTPTTGIISGRSPILALVVNSTSPAVMMAMSALVPPMSSDSAAGTASRRQIRAAAVAPEAGPDRTVSIGRAVALARLSMPPEDDVSCRTAFATASMRPPSWLR